MNIHLNLTEDIIIIIINEFMTRIRFHSLVHLSRSIASSSGDESNCPLNARINIRWSCTKSYINVIFYWGREEGEMVDQLVQAGHLQSPPGQTR